MVLRSRWMIISLVIVIIIGLLTWYILGIRSSADEVAGSTDLAAECLNETPISGPISGPNADGLTLTLETSVPRYAQGLNNPIGITISNLTETDVASRPTNHSNPSNLDTIEYFEVLNSENEVVADSVGNATIYLEILPSLASGSNLTASWNQMIGAETDTPTVAPLGIYSIRFPNTEGPLQFSFSLVAPIDEVSATSSDGSVQSFEDLVALRGTESNPAQLNDTVVCPSGIRLAYFRPSPESSGGATPPSPEEAPVIVPPRVVGPNSDGLELVMWQHPDGIYNPSDSVRMYLFNTTEVAIPSRAEVAAGESPTAKEKIDYFEVRNSEGEKIYSSADNPPEVLNELSFIAAGGYIQGIEWHQALGSGSSVEGAAPAGSYTIRFPNTAGPLEVMVTLEPPTTG